MTTQERQYMERHFSEVESEVVDAKDEAEATKLLRFACPTQAANGKWYRTTIAISNVPVRELYDVLSNANFIATRLREIAKELEGTTAEEVEQEANKVAGLRLLLKKRDETGGKEITQHDIDALFVGSNIHLPTSREK